MLECYHNLMFLQNFLLAILVLAISVYLSTTVKIQKSGKGVVLWRTRDLLSHKSHGVTPYKTKEFLISPRFFRS